MRELIRSRVYQQVRDRKLQQAHVFQGLLPKGTNQTPPEADWKLYFQAAVEAFDANRILILIDERQAETLDDEV